jgi:drug/metabolite transporter (DMT)-like permease
MLVAWIVFRENVDTRLVVGALSILMGAAILSWNFEALSYSMGAGFVALACLCWGIDNNLTRKLSVGDPVQIAMIKGLFAGGTNLSLGFLVGGELPGAGVVVMTAIVGFLAYGTSLVFFVLALRELGTARTGAYFSTAPFVGALVAVLTLGDQVGPELVIGGVLMLFGVWLHVTEVHDHWHEHEAMTHEHMHVHDEHHQHVHGPGDPPAMAAHSHVHTHEVMSHKHKHYPDLHHRHEHGKPKA